MTRGIAAGKLALLCLLLVLNVAPVIAQEQNSIEPGRGIGKIEIGASSQAVHRTLGDAAGKYRVARGIAGEYWKGKDGDTLRVFYRGNKVIQITAQSPRFSTSEGLTAQSSLDEVRKHYPNAKKSSYFANGSGGALVDYYDDVRKGIAFVFTGARTFDSAQSNPTQPYAIIVHQRARRVIADADEAPSRARTNP